MSPPPSAPRPGAFTPTDPNRHAPLAPTIPDRPAAIFERDGITTRTYGVVHDGSRADFIARACDFFAAYLVIHPEADSATIEHNGEIIVIRADDVRPGPAQ